MNLKRVASEDRNRKLCSVFHYDMTIGLCPSIIYECQLRCRGFLAVTLWAFIVSCNAGYLTDQSDVRVRVAYGKMTVQERENGHLWGGREREREEISLLRRRVSISDSVQPRA